MGPALKLRTRLAVSASASVLWLCAGGAWAQSEPTVQPQPQPQPQTQPSPGAGSETARGSDVSGLDDVVVTAQRREQSVQDVPIAVTALSSETLQNLRIEGGSELLRAVPNVTFSKSNFSMYNFSIRGVGTKAISAASDPAVAVSFNNTPLIRNRLFEQEYLDVARVEVLRGPQGTLYGRNATGGVVNLFPQLPKYVDEGMVMVELGNFDTRRAQAMWNVPIGDTFAVRGAVAYTSRGGFDYNSFNDTRVNDRDLLTTRLSARWDPNDRFSANLIWEHFEEDDARSRTGKQLCTTDPGPLSVGTASGYPEYLRAQLSQGCLPGSLFDDAAYGAPNAASLGSIRFLASGGPSGYRPDGTMINLVTLGVNPYEGVRQSRDLNEIATSFDPVFRAKNDIVQFNMEYQISDRLTLYSQTAYAKDSYYAFQDYARYVSNPFFNDSSLFVDFDGNPRPSPATPGGFYTDPQLGASNRVLSADSSQSENRQWYQEFRIQSDFDGNFNFILGGNYLDFKTQDDYYIFYNTFSLVAEYMYNSVLEVGENTSVCDDLIVRECVYVDPNPLNAINGEGHNYFRSKNVVSTKSWAVFGEGYWDLSESLRLTAGLRYTSDRKTSELYPSQLLTGAELDGTPGASTGGYVRRGLYALPDIKQDWQALSGRMVLDWKPVLSFTDDTLVYGSFSRGYKGGGTNPPRVDLAPEVIQLAPLASTFEPEYVNAFEIGTKNSLMDGRLRLNATAFYYDYTDYQVSQIVDRISLNENFDAAMWGLEFETIYRPIPAFQIDGNLGFLKTRIGSGQGSIDPMDRTQGNDDWTVIRPWIQVPSNCVAPTEYVETILNKPELWGLATFGLSALCGGSPRFGTFDPDVPSSLPMWAFYGFEYRPLE